MKKRIFLILSCVWLILSFVVIKTTYAKYLTSIDGNTSVSISTWKLLLNNQDIINEEDFSSNISLVFPETAYSIENYIVPGSIGYFDLNVDCSDVSLYFKYIVDCTFEENNEINDLKVIGFSVEGNNSSITYLDDINTQVINYVLPDSTFSSMRVYVQWNDDLTNTLDDSEDTLLALSNALGEVQVNVRFEQSY